MSSGQPMRKADRKRERAQERRAAERRQRQRQRLVYGVAGVGLIALVVMAVVAFMGGGGGDAGKPSAQGEVTVRGEPRDAPLAPGERVPSFDAPALAGGTVSWSTYEGKPTVLSIWAPWCPHCQVELPVVDRVMQGYPDVGWVTIATSIGRSGPSPARFMEDRGLDFPVAVDDAETTLAQAFGIQVFPTLYFVNSDGTVARELEGEVDESTLRSIIASLS